MGIEPNCLFEADALALMERLGDQSISLVYLDSPYERRTALPDKRSGKGAEASELLLLEFLFEVYQ